MRLLHNRNAPVPIDVTLPGMSMLVMGVAGNAATPMVCRPSCRVTVLRLLHHWNAVAPLEVTLPGMSILVMAA